MGTTANYFVLAFILLMIYWWGAQGFFSALLHLGIVIVAGALAFAFWEPVAFMLLATGRFAAHHAWGVGLLVPFGLLLFGLRLASDKLVKMNVQITQIFNLVLGGLCGFLSAALTAGILLIGLCFLPVETGFAGYQPYATQANGTGVDRQQRLWIPVDDWASGFYATLSAGAFSSRHPLAENQPDLVQQAALFRLNPDPNASTIAVPDSVTIDSLLRTVTEIETLHPDVAPALSNYYRPGDQQLLVIDTVWRKRPGTYDNTTLRVPATQIRLVTERNALGEQTIELVAPVAFAREDNPNTGERTLHLFDTDRAYASSTGDNQKLGWVFVLDADQQPKRLLVRQLPFNLPAPGEFKNDNALIAGVLGGAVVSSRVKEDAEQQPQRVASEQGVRPDWLEFTTALAGGSISSAEAPSLTPGSKTGTVLSGRATVTGQAGRTAQRTAITDIHEPSHMRTLRIKLDGEQARSIYGTIATRAVDTVGGIYFMDHRSQPQYPIGYVLVQDSNKRTISITPDQPIQRTGQLPMAEMRSGDELFLYFQVERGSTLSTYHEGSLEPQTLNLQVP